MTRMIGAGNPEAVAAGPGDIERRAGRYERRMAHSVIGPVNRDRVPVLLDTAGSQRADPGRRSPTMPPDGSPLPSETPSRITPGRRFRRSPVRNPIRRAAPEDRTGTRSRSFRRRSVAGTAEIAVRSPRHPSMAHDGTTQAQAWRKAGYARPGDVGRSPVIRLVTVGDKQLVTRSVSVRARHRRPVAGNRRWDVLLGAAFTTVLVAFPLAPGATAAAYSGGPVVLAQSFTGDTADGHGSAGAPGANSVPPGSSADGGPARTASTALDRTGHGPKPAAVSGDVTVTPAAVAACGRSGSASGSGSSPRPGSADSAAGSASGSACTVLPALGELVRTLIRLAPKIAPPCPCPNGRK